MKERKLNNTITFLLVLLCFSFSVSKAQKKGTVLFLETNIVSQNGTPIQKATIFADEGDKIGYSDEKGNVILNIATNSDIHIEAKGFRPVTLSQPIPKSIVLEEEQFLQGEQDRVLTPFSFTSKGKIVNDISVLDLQQILSSDKSSSLEEILNGRITGLFGMSNLRGMGAPTVIIDGLIRQANTVRIEEIEHISILKDVNSAILYGVKAGNGIILIKTKRGEENKRKIKFHLEQRLDIPISLPKYLSSADYMTLYNEARKNDGLPIRYTDQDIENYRTGNKFRYPNTNYYSDEFLKNSRNITDANVEFSGGNKLARYYTNIGWLGKGSLFNMGEGAKSQNNRFNIRGNVDFNLSKDITSYVDITAIIDANRMPNGNFWNYAQNYHPYYYSPLLPVDLIIDKNSIEGAKIIDNQYLLGGTTQFQDNVYGDMKLGGYQQEVQRNIHFNGGVDFALDEILKGLKLKTNLSFDFYNTYTQAVQNEYAVYQPTWNNNDSIVSLTKIGENVSNGVQNLTNGDMYRNFNVNIGLDYKHILNNEHTFSALLIAYYNNLTQNNIKVSDKYAHIGLSLMYDYKAKYLVNVSSVLSNSIKLPTHNKIGFSPTLGLGWVVSEEDFWKKNSIINYLKIKTYGGIVKTDANIGVNLYKDALSRGSSYAWGDANGYSGASTNIARVLNPNLNYEEIKNLNLGIEAYFFNKKLSIISEIFRTTYSNQVVQKINLYPAYHSAFIPYENYNENRYSGVELSITYGQKIGEFDLRVNGNFSYVKSEVIKKDEIWNENYLYRKGKPVDALFGLISKGLYQNQTQIDNSVSQRFGTVVPGDISYQDQNNDNQIDDSDQSYIGNSLPKSVFGLNIGLDYKDFSLFILGEGAAQYNAFYENSYYWIDGDKKYSEIVLGRWTPETANSASYPRLSSLSNENNFRRSTYWIYDASYFSIRRAQLSYNLNSSTLGIPFVRSAQLYIRANNLLMFCYEPEKRQMNVGSEPQYRTFALGVNLSF